MVWCIGFDWLFNQVCRVVGCKYYSGFCIYVGGLVYLFIVL